MLDSKDDKLVTLKLSNTESDLALLKELAARTVNGGDRYITLAAERLLERVVSRMIDINYLLIIAAGGAPPSGYHGSFTSLAESGVLPKGFDKKILPAARLRNRIVHEYDGVQPDEVLALVGSAADDIRVYLRAIRQYMNVGHS